MENPSETQKQEELEEGECVEPTPSLQIPPLPEVPFDQFIAFAPKTRLQLIGKWLSVKTKSATIISGFLYALDPDKNDIYLLISDGKQISVIFSHQIDTVQGNLILINIVANLSKQWKQEQK
jgi:hypothetical protein